jgi:Na+/proline symporter
MFFSASIHTPAASVYTNFSTAAKSEKILVPGFLLAGAIAMMMPFLAGLIGIVTMANYGYTRGFSSYTSITTLPTEIHPWIGGIALAAILAAVISSGGPILLSSSTMFVRDWLPYARDYTADRKLKAYRITTVIYGIVAAGFAYLVAQTTITVLDLLLFGFAMVVPPAVAIGYLIYWKRTTERGAYWGMLVGYIGGLVWFILIKWALATGLHADEGSPVWQRIAYYCFAHNGEGIDPSYATTVIPLVVVPLISLLTRDSGEGKQMFYDVVAGRRELEVSV